MDVEFEDDGITLAQLLKVLKKSFIKGVAFAAAGAIVVGGGLFAARNFTKQKTYNATFSYTSSENLYSKVVARKNVAIDNALAPYLTGDEAHDKALKDEIKANLSIVQQYGVDPATNQYTLVNTYDLVLTPSTSLGLSEEVQTAIQNGILTEYVNYNPTTVRVLPLDETLSTYNVDTALGLWEYSVLFEELSNRLETVYESAQTISEENELSTIVVIDEDTYAKISVPAILSKLNSVKGELAIYQTVTEDQNLHNVNALSSNTASLNLELAQLGKDLVAYDNILNSAKAQYDAYLAYIDSVITNPAITDVSVNIGGDPTAAALAEAVVKAKSDYELCLADIAKVQLSLAEYDSCASGERATLCNKIETILKDSNTAISSSVDQFNEIIATYNDNGFTASVVATPHEETANSISLTKLLVGAFAAAVVVFAVVYVITFVRMNKNGELEEKAEVEIETKE